MALLPEEKLLRFGRLMTPTFVFPLTPRDTSDISSCLTCSTSPDQLTMLPAAAQEHQQGSRAHSEAQQVSQGLMLKKVPIRKCDLGSAASFKESAQLLQPPLCPRKLGQVSILHTQEEI